MKDLSYSVGGGDVSTAEISVLEYQMEYPTLNLKLKKENEILFNLGMFYCYYKELKKGFVVKRFNKTTRKGTRFTYRAIKNEEDLQEYLKILEDLKPDPKVLAHYLANHMKELEK